MPKKKPSEKNKAWEKDRRDRLNKSFEQLAKLLPQYDPSVIWSKVEIIQKSIEHIECLHKRNEEFLESKGPDALTEYNDLVETVKYFQSRNGQLADLLLKAKITLPVCKPPSTGVIEKFCENNNLNKIHIKPVGRPGKYVNKVNENDVENFGNEETKCCCVKSENSNKNGASCVGTQQINGTATKQKESTSPSISATPTVTLGSCTNVERGALMEAGILVPVIPLQPQPQHQPVISSQLIPPPVISAISSLPPLINVTNLTSSSQNIVKNTTATQVFNYAKDKNGKIKILPRPQIKLYFRRADGKIPIPVIKKRVKSVKRKRKRKCKPTTTHLKSKKRKVEKCEEETKENRDSKKETTENTKNTTDKIIVKPPPDSIGDMKCKNSENISNTPNEVPVQPDYLSELEIPQSETNPISVSPTAAFLMSFPVVNTSNGKFSGIVDENEILTPNLERKDSGVDNLENLNNFFTTKEYTKYCRENSEKNINSQKNGERIMILEDIKIPPVTYNPSTFFNPFSITSSSTTSTTSTTTIACSFNDVISQPQLSATKQQISGNSSYLNPINSNPQIDIPKTKNMFEYSNIRTNATPFFNQDTTGPSKALNTFSNEIHTLPNPSLTAKVALVSTTSTRSSVSIAKKTNLAINNSFQASTTTASTTLTTVLPFYSTAGVSLAPPALSYASLTSTFSTSSIPICAPSIAPISVNSSIPTLINSSTVSISSAASNLNYHRLQNSSYSGDNFTNNGIFTNQVVSTTPLTISPIWPVSVTSNCLSFKTSTAAPVYTSAATTFPNLCFSKSSTRSATQNLFSSVSKNTFNSFSPNLAPRCTPLPLDSSLKQVNSSGQNLLDNKISTNLTQPSMNINNCPKQINNCNNLPTSITLTQKTNATFTPSFISVADSKPPKFLCPPLPSGATNMSLPIFITEPNCTAIKTSISASHVSLPSFTNYNMSQSSMPLSSKIDEVNVPNSISCSRTVKSQSIPPLITSEPRKSSISIEKSLKPPSTNLSTPYIECTSQSLINTNMTSTHTYVSAANYYYPQARSTFSLNLTTPSNVSSQIVSSQGVLPYSPLKPDMSWMPPISKEYKPSFTFSLTPTSSTSCKQSGSNSFISPAVTTSTFSTIPSISKESKITTKPVFNPFDSSTRFKTPTISNIKDPGNSFASSTSFTFSLTNPKASIITTAESKVPFTSTSAKIQQQFNNFDGKYQSSPANQLFNFNIQPENTQKDLCFTFALTKTSKTVTTVQKSRNPFTIDATLGIANSSTCYLDGGNKSSNTTLCPAGDVTKIHSNRNKLPNKIDVSINVPLQVNNFYECSQKPEKFGQRAHVNWMTSSEVPPSTADYGQTSSYRTPTDSYHPYGVCDENFPSWSPSKIYDTSHLIVPPAATVPNYYSDISFNTPTYNIASGILDTPSKLDKNYKPPMGNGNQANFFSVSQLVDQGTNSKQYDGGYQKKISPSKSKDSHKEEDFKSPYLNNVSHAVFSENITYNGPPKAPLSNNYSAEALISKKEKHRNFGSITTTEFYNSMDVSGMYNQPEQSYNSNYFYNYPTNQNYGQDPDYLGAYTSDNQFGKVLNKHNKKLPPPTAPPPPPPPNLISYDSSYFPVPLAVSSPLNPLPSIDGYDSHHYNHSGNFQTNSWGTKAATLSGYQNQGHHFQPTADIGQMNSELVQNSVQPSASGNLANFNLSTICPEINDKVATPNVW